MPATANPAPAEIAALERRIAEEVMGWTEIKTHPALHRYHKNVNDSDAWVRISENVDPESRRYWSPWNDSADALEVLERLVDIMQERAHGRKPAQQPDTVITLYRDPREWEVRIGCIVSAHFTGPHFGPAVCLLAERATEESLTDSRNRR